MEGTGSLTVIVPAFNEAGTVLQVLDRLRSVEFPVPVEILVVDDGSTDGTSEALGKAGLPGVRILRHERNRGKGAAIRTGIEAASGEFLVIQDADLEYDPGELPGLLAPLLAGEGEVVYGSRILKPDNPASYHRYYWGGRLVTFWTNLLYGSSLTDEPTCYKLFRTELLRGLELRCTGFEFCPEVTGKILNRGIGILERPISYRPRSIEEGKKIRWWDGVVALWTLLRLRLLG